MSITELGKTVYHYLIISALLIMIIICSCIKRQILNEKDELQKIDTLTYKKVMTETNAPSFDTPVIELQSTITGSGKEQYRRTTFYNHRPTILGWSVAFIPSLAVGILGYTKITTGSVVMGRDLLGLSVLPPLLTFGFSKIVFKKHKTVEKPFTFNIPNSTDQIGIQINSINYMKPTNPDKNGLISINLYDLLGKFPQSNLNVYFTCSDKYVNPYKTTISYALMKKLWAKQICGEIDTICFIADRFQHSLILLEASLLSGFNTEEGLGYIINGLEECTSTKNIYKDMHKPTLLKQAYDELDLAVPKISQLFNLFQEYLSYGRVISYISSERFKELWHDVLVGEGKYAQTIITRKLEKPLKHDLETIGLSEMLRNHIWFTLIGSNYTHLFLNNPARRDSIVQEVFNQLSNR